MADQFGEGRAARRNQAGVSAGAASGATLGLILGSFLPGVGNLAGVAIGGVVGAVTGGLIGRRVASRVSIDEWDPSAPALPYVGAHAPDDDTSAGVEPARGPERPARQGRA